MGAFAGLTFGASDRAHSYAVGLWQYCQNKCIFLLICYCIRDNLPIQYVHIVLADMEPEQMKYTVYTLSTEYDMTQVLIHADLHADPDFDVLDYVNSSFHEHVEITIDGVIEIDNPAGMCLPGVLLQGD